MLVGFAALSAMGGQAWAAPPSTVTVSSACEGDALVVTISAPLDGELLIVVEGHGADVVSGPGTFTRPAADVGPQGTPDDFLLEQADDGWIAVAVHSYDLDDTLFYGLVAALDCAVTEVTDVPQVDAPTPLPSTGSAGRAALGGTAMVVVGVALVAGARRRPGGSIQRARRDSNPQPSDP